MAIIRIVNFLCLLLCTEISITAMELQKDLSVSMENLQLEPYVKFKCSDGKIIKMPTHRAYLSQTLKNIIVNATESCNEIPLPIDSNSLKFIEKVLRTIERKYGNNAHTILQQNHTTDRAILFCMNFVLKPEQYDTVQMAAHYLTLPLLFNIIKAKEKLENYTNNMLESLQGLSDIKQYLVSFLHDDPEFLSIKKWILERIEVPETEKEISGDFYIYSKYCWFNANAASDHIKIYNHLDGIIKEIPFIDIPNMPARLCGVISNDSKLLTLYNDKTIYIINTQTLATVKTLSKKCGHPYNWSPNNIWLVLLSDQNNIRLFNIETDECKIIDGFDYKNGSISWSSDGLYIAFAKDRCDFLESMVEIWNAVKNELIRTISINARGPIKWIKNRKQLYCRLTGKKPLFFWNLETVCLVDDYFNNRLNSFDEIMLLKKIEKERKQKKQYKLSQEDLPIFNAMGKNNDKVGNAIRTVIKPILSNEYH